MTGHDGLPDASESRPTQPLLRVVRGNPTDEEFAALVAVVAVRRAAATTSEGTGVVRRSGWTERARGLREPLRPGPHGWRNAALPR